MILLIPWEVCLDQTGPLRGILGSHEDSLGHVRSWLGPLRDWLGPFRAEMEISEAGWVPSEAG